jgi:hypothetical protein
MSVKAAALAWVNCGDRYFREQVIPLMGSAGLRKS